MSIHRLGANTDWAAKNRTVLVAFSRNYSRGGRGSTIRQQGGGGRNPGQARQAGSQRIVEAYDFLVAKLNPLARTATPGRGLPQDGGRTD